MPMNKDEEVIEGLVADLKEVKGSLTKQQTELKEAHTQLMDSVTKGLKLDKESQESIDKALTKANETGTQVQELAQKIDGLQKQVKEGLTLAGPMTLNGALNKAMEANKEKYEAFAKRDAKSLRLTLKAVTGASVAGLKPNPYVDTLVSKERQPLRIRDLLTTIPVNTDSVRYGKQDVRTNAARIVAEGTAKPYSNYTWVNATASVEVIAHLAKMTLQAIADAPRLVGEIESEMRYGLALVGESELLNGDGTTGHLSGLIDNATAYAVPGSVDAANIITQVDQLRIAILQIHLAYAAPDAHVLNPVDMANIELLRRDPDKGGGYVFGDPDSGDPVLRLWRLPTVESPSMAAGKFLTGAFKYSANLYQRDGVEVLISTENDDDFEKNLATMRCEERFGLAVRRPYGIVYGDFADGS